MALRSRAAAARGVLADIIGSNDYKNVGCIGSARGNVEGTEAMQIRAFGNATWDLYPVFPANVIDSYSDQWARIRSLFPAPIPWGTRLEFADNGRLLLPDNVRLPAEPDETCKKDPLAPEGIGLLVGWLIPPPVRDEAKRQRPPEFLAILKPLSLVIGTGDFRIEWEIVTKGLGLGGRKSRTLRVGPGEHIANRLRTSQAPNSPEVVWHIWPGDVHGHRTIPGHNDEFDSQDGGGGARGDARLPL